MTPLFTGVGTSTFWGAKDILPQFAQN